MNMRQLKRNTIARMFCEKQLGWWIDSSNRPGVSANHGRADLIEFADNISNDTMSLGDLLLRKINEDRAAQEEVEVAKIEYICLKVKDDSVVDVFDTREEALALVLKHARQKKAKLYAMNSATGVAEVFTEEEMA